MWFVDGSVAPLSSPMLEAQDQRFRREFGEEEDSWSTCVAMLVGVPTEDVPNFTTLAIRDTGYPGDLNAFPIQAYTRWVDLTDAWLAKLDPPRELRRLDRDEFDDSVARTCSFEDVVRDNPDTKYVIVRGMSAIGNYPHHVIVDLEAVRARRENTGYDPHPAREGVSDWRQIFEIVERTRTED